MWGLFGCTLVDAKREMSISAVNSGIANIVSCGTFGLLRQWYRMHGRRVSQYSRALRIRRHARWVAKLQVRFIFAVCNTVAFRYHLPLSESLESAFAISCLTSRAKKRELQQQRCVLTTDPIPKVRNLRIALLVDVNHFCIGVCKVRVECFPFLLSDDVWNLFSHDFTQEKRDILFCAVKSNTVS